MTTDVEARSGTQTSGGVGDFGFGLAEGVVFGAHY